MSDVVARARETLEMLGEDASPFRLRQLVVDLVDALEQARAEQSHHPDCPQEKP